MLFCVGSNQHKRAFVLFSFAKFLCIICVYHKGGENEYR